MLLQRRTFLLTACAATIALASSPGHADIVPPKVYTVTPPGVSLADGSFTFSSTDLSIGPLTLQRFHLGGRTDPNIPYFGPRMSHNFDLFVAKNRRTECAEQGCTTFYRPIVHLGTEASGSFYETMPPNVVILHDDDDSYKGELTKNASGAYVYTDQAGTIYTFSTTVAAAGVPDSQRVSSIVFADGRRQDFAYVGGNQLKTVSDSSGYALVFDYDGSGYVSSACGYNLAQTYVSTATTCAASPWRASYGYASGKLFSATDAGGRQTTYTYTGGEIACVSQPAVGGCSVSNTYGSSFASAPHNWQVTSQTLADGAVWQYSYSGDYLKPRDPDKSIEVEPATQVIVTNPLGKTSSYTYVGTSPYGATDENGLMSSYRYQGGWSFHSNPEYAQNHGSMLVQAVSPGGNTYTAAYGGNMHAVTEQTWHASSGGAVRSVTFGYPPACAAPYTPQNCAKPLWKRDAKNNQTDYAYTGFGAVQWEMQPAAGAGAPRLLKLYAYVQRYAYVRNASGGLVAAAAPIWLPSTETLCQTASGSGTPTCDPGAPQTTTSYEYGPDGTADSLLVRGRAVSADGVVRRTCLRYDGQGNQVSVTLPRAGLGACA